MTNVVTLSKSGSKIFDFAYTRKASVKSSPFFSANTRTNNFLKSWHCIDLTVPVNAIVISS